jgi:HAD superfamily hydrolase (TIGR01509 family)
VTIAAVLFDMDGTLVDSEKVWDLALGELAAEYGGTLSTTARLAMVGTSMAESMAILHADLGQPWRDAAGGADRLERRVAELFAAGLEWRAGARALLRDVRAAGLPTALVTSTARRLVDVALGTLGRDSFDIVVCGDEVDRPKPHPAPYLAAADALGVPIARCVAVEDSPHGVASARAAGAVVLAVPCEVALSDLDGVDGVHVRESLAEVDLSVLAELARRGVAR